jgi:hypothetical protein
LWLENRNAATISWRDSHPDRRQLVIKTATRLIFSARHSDDETTETTSMAAHAWMN